jgi:8-oxo-dGTP pyrophosphatase MutT (NUDIX family)
MAVRFERSALQRYLARRGGAATGLAPDQRLAAVFALLVDRDQTGLLFIRRAELGDPWSGQIAFPGGHVQADDRDALAACYRELEEEVGIERQAVTCLGDLGCFPTQTHRVVVRVFVGWWDGLAPPRPDAIEVAAVFETPVAHLLAHHHRQGFNKRTAEEIGRDLIYPLPGNPGEVTDDPNAAIWGVTARILHSLLGVMAEATAGP